MNDTSRQAEREAAAKRLYDEHVDGEACCCESPNWCLFEAGFKEAKEAAKADLFGVNLPDISLEAGLRFVLDRYDHEDWCPVERHTGGCACGMQDARETVGELIWRLRSVPVPVEGSSGYEQVGDINFPTAPVPVEGEADR